jgi:predicted ATPase
MIVSFAYEDLDTGWTLEEVRFDPLNLLVGPSGAGKTRILQALRDIRSAALVGARGVPSARWKLVVKGAGEEHGRTGRELTWKAETQVTRAEMPPPGKSYDVELWRAERTDARFVSEAIELDGQELVKRNGGSFEFDRKPLPRLTDSESAIGLLGSEESLWPLHESIRLWRFFEDQWFHGAIDTVSSAENSLKRFGGRLDLLQRDDRLPTFVKLYGLQKEHADLFDRVVEEFVDVFPTIEELKVATYAELGFRPNLGESFMANSLAVGWRETGVDGWVIHHQWSSGMEKTLKLLIETTLAPKGAVLLIDELENSLGVNCLPEVAGLMLKGLDRIQYIATSHHPRVINGIPYERWKLVTRQGAVVKVIDAGSIPALKTASSLEKFTQLINLREYEEGIA